MYKIFPCPICSNPSKNLNFFPSCFYFYHTSVMILIESRDDQAPKIRCGLLTSLLISFVRRLTMHYTGLKKWGKVTVCLCKEKSIDFNLWGNSARNFVILLHFFSNFRALCNAFILVHTHTYLPSSYFFFFLHCEMPNLIVQGFSVHWTQDKDNDAQLRILLRKQ